MIKSYLKTKFSVYYKIFLLVLPIVLSSFLQHIVSAADNFMVAIVSTNQKDALTAVGIVSQLVIFTIAFF